MKVWNYLIFLSKVQTPESLPYQEEYSIIHFNLISSPFSLIFSSPSVLDKTSISKINKYIPLKTKFERNQYSLLLKFKINIKKRNQYFLRKLSEFQIQMPVWWHIQTPLFFFLILYHFLDLSYFSIPPKKREKI